LSGIGRSSQAGEGPLSQHQKVIGDHGEGNFTQRWGLELDSEGGRSWEDRE
jgi:hypothetical protein